EDLQKRLEEGKIYPRERIQTALQNFFISSNLEKLRELTLRELASQIDLRRREVGEETSEITPDQVMVCLSSRGPNSDKLLRYASRLAGRLNRNWYAVYVQTPSEEATVIDAKTQRLLSETLTLAKQLGAMVFTYKGEDIADTILRFAREYRVGHIIIGYPGRKSFFRRFGRNKDVVGDLIQKNMGPTVIILDTREPVSEPAFKKISEPPPLLPQTVAESGTSIQAPALLSSLLSPGRIILWNQPISRTAALRQLVTAVSASAGLGRIESILEIVMKREEEGSTFFNEGAAFPHARISGLAEPVVALGLSKEGISDVKTEKPIAMVLLILSPAENPDIQVKILGLAGRAALNRSLTHSLSQARSPEEVLEAVRLWESDT
ncbi:MAG TPA: PTS sugar transporter subunit IIA, partial [Thermodesulfobacteriota bacterium]|nr:PTS sugar transporter subunit IIA [Thermodesulfobacteriota bacterium]